MNHLHQLLAAIDTRVVARDPTLSVDAAVELLRLSRVAAGNAQCFDIGDMSAICELQVVPELARLPYRAVWFEGHQSDSMLPQARIGLLAVEDDDGTVDCVCFVYQRRIWALMWLVRELDMRAGTYWMTTDTPEVATAVNTGIFALRAFCCALNCTNVERRQHAPDIKLQKARARRGKVPLFSYWTLELKGRRECGSLMGGTHASPRVHLRRGHPRQYAPGQWTWVQAHAVGNRAAGVVHKDYSAGPALTATARQNGPGELPASGGSARPGG